MSNTTVSSQPANTAPVAVVEAPNLDWPAIIAGAIAAAAVSVVFVGFGSALGLSMTSARPYAGFSSTVIAIVAALWFAFVYVGAFMVGGYVAGRMARGTTASAPHEREFHHGVHGFLVWSLGTLVGAYMLASVASSVASKAIDTAGKVVGATAQIAGTAAGATAGATAASGSVSDLSNYAVDKMLRRAPGTPSNQTPAASAETTRENAEIGRILATAWYNGALESTERDYIASIVAVRTGTAPQDAARRVDDAFNSVQTKTRDAEAKARDIAETARKNAILAAFLAAAVSLAGLVGATWGASTGATDRESSRRLTVFGQQRFW